MNYKDCLADFFAVADEQYNSFNRKLLNGEVKTIGCRVPFVRAYAKAHLSEYADILAFPYNDYHEIDMLKGMVTVQLKLPFEEKRNYVDNFVAAITNWAVCDTCTVKVLKNEREKWYGYFKNLVLSKASEFSVRYGIINILSLYLDDDHIDDIFVLLDKVTYGAYYVDMAAAWLIATAMAKYPDKTVSYMERINNLNEFTYAKALAKMRDSYRISAADKQWTRDVCRKQQ